MIRLDLLAIFEPFDFRFRYTVNLTIKSTNPARVSLDIFELFGDLWNGGFCLSGSLVGWRLGGGSGEVVISGDCGQIGYRFPLSKSHIFLTRVTTYSYTNGILDELTIVPQRVYHSLSLQGSQQEFLSYIIMTLPQNYLLLVLLFAAHGNSIYHQQLFDMVDVKPINSCDQTNSMLT